MILAGSAVTTAVFILAIVIFITQLVKDIKKDNDSDIVMGCIMTTLFSGLAAVSAGVFLAVL